MGIDVELAHLATLVQEDGTVEKAPLAAPAAITAAAAAAQQEAKRVEEPEKVGPTISPAVPTDPPLLLAYKCQWYGSQLVKANRYFPSSKTCSCCGQVLESFPLDVRDWDCPACGTHHDREVNAAKNLLALALA